MKTNSYKPSGSPALMLATGALVLAGTLATTAFNPFKAMKRARMAETVAHGRHIKLMLDLFAIDNDGVYPSPDFAEFYEIPNKDKTSNSLFTQLFASGCTNSEKIFWVNGAQVCNVDPPDDVTTKRGVFDFKETLKPGDCGWAFMRDQTNVDRDTRPILLEAFLPGTKKFDPNLHEGRVIVVFIDGSAKPIELDPKGRVMDQGEDLLSPKSKIWRAWESPVDLLAQPRLSKAAQKKVEENAKAPKEDAKAAKEDAAEGKE